MPSTNVDVIIVGAGLAGLACAVHLKKNGVSFLVLEADARIGGRLKTDKVDGFLLNHGFQVLQTAYPEARRMLDYDHLQLKSFAPGAIVRTNSTFFRIADPKRRPRDLWSTLTAPIGTFADRLRMLRLTVRARRNSVSQIFHAPDQPTITFLKAEGFSEKMIQRFFKPFFGGVCLDPDIMASSRVFRYVLRIFAESDIALPAKGMAAIPAQIAENLPDGAIRTGNKVKSVDKGGVELVTGEIIKGRLVVLATQGPETARLLGDSEVTASHGEWCLYYAAKTPPIPEPYLVLNGKENGWINSLTVPSIVAPSYAPEGNCLINAVVLGHLDADIEKVETTVRQELMQWFGATVETWRHLKTYRILHGLPAQAPPMPDPTVPSGKIRPDIYVCGEYHSVPGIQWALLSGRQTAELIVKDLAARA